jgi:immune inhibitor A
LDEPPAGGLRPDAGPFHPWPCILVFGPEPDLEANPLKKKHWLLLLGIALALVTLCSCVAVVAMASFVLWAGATPSTPVIVDWTSLLEPTPVPELIRRPPIPAERETGYRVATTTLPPRDLQALAHSLQGLAEPPVTPTEPPGFELGDREVFWLHNVHSNAFFTATATLSYETPHAYWWIEEGYDVPARDLQRSAERFEDTTYPTNRRLFGSEWSPGVDGDLHVYIFLGNVPGVGGYYSSPDEYPVEIRPRSNEHEMFYISLDNAMPGNDYFDGILAHEFQHMIHWAVDRDEETWVNEGLSELAAQVNGFDVGGSERLFSLAPDTQLTTWPELEDSAPHYGASYLFLAYFLERYGEDAVRRLVAEPANDRAGFDAVLAEVDPNGRSFDDLFADWVVANYLDEVDLGGGHYGYADLALQTPVHSALHTEFPARHQDTVHQYAVDYILLEGEGDLTVEFTGSLVVPLVGNEAHSGEFQWWSNRGDEGDVTLTRAFDLTDLEEATLQAWMWYDLETDYDYAYVEVSTDGGDTWHLLANDHTTTTNPSENSYGPGFTGTSGGGKAATWVEETFDLTPYAGQPVLVRFQVITDDSVNRPGLCLDDISIPELAYHDDVEGGTGGWQAAGWIRATAQIPQDYLVQIILIGSEVQVERMSLDEQMRGTTTIAGLGDDVGRAVLAISAMAPATTERAAYSVRVTPR